MSNFQQRKLKGKNNNIQKIIYTYIFTNDLDKCKVQFKSNLEVAFFKHQRKVSFRETILIMDFFGGSGRFAKHLSVPFTDKRWEEGGG